jgi:uncharacterized membrane protein
MRTVSTGIVATGLFLAAGCGVGSDVAGGSDEAESSINAKQLQYEAVDITAAPAGQDFWFPVGPSDKAEVYGTGFDCDDEYLVCTFTLFKLQTNGQFASLEQNFSASDVNGNGDVGGCVITDSVSFFGQAAIRSANGKLQVLPRLVDEVSSCVNFITESGLVLVTSFTATYDVTVYVFDKGRTTVITPPGSILDINDRGQIAGIVFDDPEGNRAYRFDSSTQTTTILDPVSPDPHSWGQAINKHGEVLGYSFIFSAIERIGKWNRRNQFETSFVEGTPEFPTISNKLNWNEAGLIVISQTTVTDGGTYLVPAPGIRLNLADIVVGPPPSDRLVAQQLNKDDDFTAQSLLDGRLFLLRRN